MCGSSENQPRLDNIVIIEVSVEEGASGLVENPSDLFYEKFILFHKLLALLVDENNEIVSLLRKLESKKQHKASVARRKPPSPLPRC